MLIIDALLIILTLSRGEKIAEAAKAERASRPLGVPVGLKDKEALLASLEKLVPANAQDVVTKCVASLRPFLARADCDRIIIAPRRSCARGFILCGAAETRSWMQEPAVLRPTWPHQP